MNSRSTLLAVAFAAVGVLSACSSDEVPAHQHPDLVPDPPPAEKIAATVTSFTVEPAAIKPGEKATLKWAVKDALSLSIKDGAGRGVPNVSPTGQEGTVEVTPAETTFYVINAHGEGGNALAVVEVAVTPDPIIPPEQPLLFTAVPSEIAAGDTAHLVWNAPGKVTVTSDTGVTVDTKDAVSGSLPLALTKTTTFTARSGTQEVTTKVTVVPALISFSSFPASASAGQEIKLTWRTAGADEVKISERSRGELHTAAANERNEGTFADTIPAGLPNGNVLVYTLSAKNGSATRTTTLQITVSNTPTISKFELEHPILTAGGSRLPKLTWTTANAVRVLLYSGTPGAPANTLIYRSPSQASATAGTLDLPLPAASADYELIAEAEQGGQTSQRISLKIVPAPAITSFTATPPTVASGGTLSKLAWATTGGAELVVTRPDGSAVTSTKSLGVIGNGSVDVFPGDTTEYTLTVKNEALDVATAKATVTVTSPLQITFSPAIAIPGETVQLDWSFSTVATSVIGAPDDQETQGSDTFVDLSVSTDAKELTTLATTSTTQKVESFSFPDSFKFRHYGVLYDSLTVSSHGWAGFGAQTAISKPAALKTTSNPNNLIAPFYNSQGYGKVYWELRGTAPDRKLIVQWKDQKTSSSDASHYNYEIVLNESGQIDFLYDVMDRGTASTGPEPLIGLENQNGTDGVVATFHGTDANSIPAQGQHAVFFGPSPATGSATITAVDTATYQLRVALTSGGVATVSGTLPVVKAGDLDITEIMYKPVVGAAKGKWIEIRNNSSTTLDSGDIVIVTNGAPTGTALPSGTPIVPGDYVVIGESKILTENGDTVVDIEAPLALDPAADTVVVQYRTLAMGAMSYDDGVSAIPEGQSFIIPLGSYITPAGTQTCYAPTAYGTAGSKGSPGAATTGAGSNCPYFGSAVSSAFADISASGTEHILVTATSSSNYRLRKKLTFPAGFSFPFDGGTMTEAVVSTCGYLTFDPSATDSNSDPQCDNLSSFPGTTTLKGVIAPFWDRTWYASSGLPRPAIYTKLVDPDNNPATTNSYLIIQWVHYPHYWGSGSNPSDSNFEARLFQNGDIEFHYGLLEPGGADIEDVEGISATIGVSDMLGTSATVFSHNQQKLKANTAIRWTKN